jgi:chromosome segregation protein
VAAERLHNAGQRRAKAGQDRTQAELRAAQAERERDAAAAEQASAERDLLGVQAELERRTGHEQGVRDRLGGQRATVRALEEELQQRAEATRALEGERAALERERAGLKQQLGQAASERATREGAERAAALQVDALALRAAARAREALAAVEAVERERRRVAAAKEREANGRAVRRQAEEALAQVTARREALAELDRERVGLAPAAQALLKAKAQFGDGVLGPLADFVRTSRRDAELAERLLGEWLHAVLVRDASIIDDIRRWHAGAQPGPLLLLPCVPGPRLAADGHPLKDELRADGPAAAWVRALLAGHEVLDDGYALRRANGAVFLAGVSSGGPLLRRAELEGLEHDVQAGETARSGAAAEVDEALGDLTAAEAAHAAAAMEAERARQLELETGAHKGDAERAVAHAHREVADAEAQVARLSRRLAEVEARLTALHVDLERQELERVRLDERLEGDRARLAELDVQQEAAREERVRWQVEAAQMEARRAAAAERAIRAAAEAEAARLQAVALVQEIGEIDRDAVTLDGQRTLWEDTLKERRQALGALGAAALEAETRVRDAEAEVTRGEADLEEHRQALDALGSAGHRLELERSEVLGRKQALAARVEAEWRKPLDQLLAQAPEVPGDIDWLRQENERLKAAIDAVGPVNALAVDEHGEEAKRLEFLMTQRDDLVAARSSLQQAAREIDLTAKGLFLESFGKVRENFRTVFQTLFGGGECDVRLANEDEPLESEIEIHAAPRGKRTQRIHLLSSGERTLVAVSLLFAIFLAKPSPFCLLDEVDAPLDDANVGRYVRLLSEFKDQTQFIVITHNPRTMQAADAVYGVTMQEPGVSTIVGVRLGQMEPV